MGGSRIFEYRIMGAMSAQSQSHGGKKIHTAESRATYALLGASPVINETSGVPNGYLGLPPT